MTGHLDEGGNVGVWSVQATQFPGQGGDVGVCDAARDDVVEPGSVGVDVEGEPVQGRLV